MYLQMLSKNVKVVRKSRKLSQEKFALKAGVGKSTIHAIETCTENTSLGTIILMEKNLGLLPGTLLADLPEGSLALLSVAYSLLSTFPALATLPAWQRVQLRISLEILLDALASKNMGAVEKPAALKQEDLQFLA